MRAFVVGRVVELMDLDPKLFEDVYKAFQHRHKAEKWIRIRPPDGSRAWLREALALMQEIGRNDHASYEIQANGGKGALSWGLFGFLYPSTAQQTGAWITRLNRELRKRQRSPRQYKSKTIERLR